MLGSAKQMSPLYSGIYKIHIQLFKEGDMSTKSKNLTDMVDTICETNFIWNKDGGVALEDAVVEDFAFTPGKNPLLYFILQWITK